MNAVLNHGGAWCKITLLCAESCVVFECSYYTQLQQQLYELFLARNFSGRYFCKSGSTFNDI